MGRVEEQLISEATAKLAWEKGFDPICWDYWYAGNLFLAEFDDGPAAFNTDPDYAGAVAASTQSLLQKWLRDVHGIDIWVVPEWTDHTRSKVEYIGFYCGRLPWEEEDPITEDDYFDTYEEALESTLKQALEFI